MRLTKRVQRLYEHIPEPRRQTHIPTGSLTEFIRGMIAGTFRVGDLDFTNFEHVTAASLLNVCLVTLGPEHQAHCDANPWARAQQDAWERDNLLLTPAEMATLRAMASV
ncbi:MAG: hypothetical protein K8U57_28880 [Planctomycetes bacterium]|nr:hypothetical protein [Planctomycetota bacterium]